ncbi:hypothetical protein HZH66_011638 [Vespula vulgaris]|uniref:MYND-type domain-containing protein n=1 Tax=Vespula vulgaris TaxID=7454 RepID=A0A834JDS5_VESVU|nr:hypothetical protein HZH66_011638 [Vespula vulgaris]
MPVDLGFVEKCEPWRLESRFFPSKVGGRPAWLNLKNIPRKEDLECEYCRRPCIFLCQIYAPYEEDNDAFHRTLFNPFYPSEPPVEEENWKTDISIDTWCKTCCVCGIAAPNHCSKCKIVNYCCRDHQIYDWKQYHKHNCGNNVNISNSFLFPEYELVIETEENTNEDDEDCSEVEEKEMAKYKSMTQLKETGFFQTEKDTEDLSKMANADEDEVFALFRTRIEQNPEQVLRYERNGQILYISGNTKIKDVPKCSLCGTERQFEFQIMPQLLNFFNYKDVINSIDWGILVIFTCKKSCMPKEEYAMEYIWKQDILSDKHLTAEHVNKESHIKAMEMFIKYFEITKSITIKCKICQVTGTWELITYHAKTHKLTPWYKPKDKYKRLYCNKCNVIMINEGSIKSHLNRHVRLRHKFANQNETKATPTKIIHLTSTSNYSDKNISNEEKKIQSPGSSQTIAFNKTKIVNKLKKTILQNNKLMNKTLQDKHTQPIVELSKQEKKTEFCSFDTECIFFTAKEIKSSVYLSIFKENNNIYCLVCQKDISNNFQIYYDHIFSIEHLIRLIDINIKKDRKEFIIFASINEDNKDSIDKFVTCMLCNTEIRNIDESLSKHIELKDHASYYCKWKKTCSKFYNDILTFIKYNWYYTTKYYCDICLIEFSSEICFAKHMNKNGIHLNSSNANYHSCVPCSLLWYGNNLSYSNHSKTPKHQFMISYGTCVTNKFPPEAERFLISVEENVEELLKFSYIADKSKENEILTRLKNDTVSTFNVVKAYPYGSRICGSGLPDSDINIFLDCLNTYNGTSVHKKNYSLETTVETIDSILSSKPSVWYVNEIILDDRTTIMKVWYIPMQLHCTISFKNGLDVESTNLIKHFNEIYLPCRKLILVLKKWLSFCGLSGFPCISNYALTWCIIFYLQIMLILPSVTELIQDNNKSKFIDGWQTGVSYKFSARDTSEFPFIKLLLGFFIFYAEFDYRSKIICPLLGKTIERKIFTDLTLLPNDMAPYVQYLKNTKNPKLFCLSPMCVQDPFNLSDNLTVMQQCMKC